MKTRVLLIAFFCIGCIQIGNSFAQQVEIVNAAKKLNPTFYLNHSVYSELELDQNQIAIVDGFRKQNDQWITSSKFREHLNRGQYDRIREKFATTFFGVEDVLNGVQKKRYLQLVSASYFCIRSNLVLVNQLQQDPSHFVTPPWFSHELSGIVGITEEQRNKVIQLVKTQTGKFKEVDAGTQKKIEQLYERWQQELFSKLTKKQKNDFKSALGEDFSFPKSHRYLFKNAYQHGCRALKMGENLWAEGQISRPSGFQYLVNLESKVDGRYELSALFELLLAKELSSEIDLSKEQKEDIEGLKAIWEIDHPSPKSVYFRNDFGLCRPGLIVSFKDNDEYQSVMRKIYRILKPVQKKRVRQIWNRIVMNFGWKEVPLAHPSWVFYLRIDSEAKSRFDEINKKFKGEFQAIVDQQKLTKQTLLSGFPKQLEAVLDEKQKGKLQELFGQYWLGEGLVP